jgi:hypothetical protein
MRLSVADVLAHLRAAGLAPAGVDDAARAALAEELRDDMPWHIRTAVGAGAWLATGFLLASLFTIAGLRDSVERFVVGLLLVVAAVLVRRTANAEFLRQAAVAASLAGQALIIRGIGDRFESVVMAATASLALSVVLLWLIPDRVHRFLSAIIGAVSLAVAAVASKAPGAFDVSTLVLVACIAYVWRIGIRGRSAVIAEILEPVGYGLIVGLFGILLFSTATSLADGPGSVTISVNHVGRDFGDPRQALGPVVAIGIAVALMLLVWMIFDEHRASHGGGPSVAALAGVAALAAGSLSSPGIVAGAAALVLAFDRRDRVLLGLSTIFLLVFGSAYYYSLDLTLLEKSGVLAGSGVLLLAIRHRIAPGDGGVTE